jgi:hypothetical protein
MIQIKNLLPSDTRAAEILSGFSLIISSILILYNQDSVLTHSMKETHHWIFWVIVLFIFGFLQIASLLKNWDGMVRAIISLVVGIFWFWIGVSICQHALNIVYIMPIVLGVICHYSYVINLLYAAKKSWI